MTNAKSQISATVQLAMDLVARRSITPDDAGCQAAIAERLARRGFTIEPMRFGDVDNLWARRGTQGPLFVFAGHTDVVPPGDEADWLFPPFTPTIHEGKLFGRGTADMKCAISSMVTAVERFIANHSTSKSSLGFLITSDEEGDAADGTVRVIETLEARGEKIDYCLVGESTSTDTVCDTMKNGRRGTLTAQLTIKGIQGHVAYPDRARNPIHQSAAAIAELCQQKWDQGNEFFSPTTMQFSNIHAGTGADNVIPGSLTAVFNFRFSSAVTDEDLRQQVHAVLDKHGLDYAIAWHLGGRPFLTQPGLLTAAVQSAVNEVVKVDCQFSTTGGTSDARFVAPTGAQVIELGLVNATIHKVDEHVLAADIDTLAVVYERILEKLLLL